MRRVVVLEKPHSFLIDQQLEIEHPKGLIFGFA